MVCSGNTSLKEKDGRGRPTLVDNNQLRALVEANPKTTVRELSIELGVSHVTVVSHLKEIGKRKKLDKWVPHHLTDNHQNRRLEVASSLPLRHRNEPFLKRIMTCDEKWIFFDNTRRGGQWLDIDELPRHFPKQDLFPKKVMVSVWWGVTGIIHYSFLKRGKTITSESCSQELEIAYQKLERQSPNLANRKGVILLHDNARPHIGKVTQKKLSDLGIEVLPHPPYSPDLSPTDYHFFKHL
jgi:histone-lysine N-methyltransferase SETMAR